MSDADTIAKRYVHLVEQAVDEMLPVLRLPYNVDRADMLHVGEDTVYALAKRTGDGPGFAELAGWGVRAALIDYVAAVAADVWADGEENA